MPSGRLLSSRGRSGTRQRFCGGGQAQHSCALCESATTGRSCPATQTSVLWPWIALHSPLCGTAATCSSCTYRSASRLSAISYRFAPEPALHHWLSRIRNLPCHTQDLRVPLACDAAEAATLTALFRSLRHLRYCFLGMRWTQIASKHHPTFKVRRSLS